MNQVRILTTKGTERTLDENGGVMTIVASDALKAAFRGRLLSPTEPGYDESRVLWNAMIDRKPGLIARCTGAADVIAAVNFARENNLVVSVRGGGHNVAGFAVSDAGLMIDLSPMKGIRVDPAARVAWAQPGLTWGEFDHETQAFGLATTGGWVPSTGIAGLTLGGGIGFLVRRFGLACDNLLAADVVTADGRLLRASKTENADLFWAVRGGGGNFGVVTSFEYRLHPVGPLILGGLLLHPLPEAKKIVRFYHEYAQQAPDELMVHCDLVTGPDGRRAVGFILCWSGSIEEGKKWVQPLRECGSLAADMVQAMPYTALQAIGGNLLPAGRHNYWKSSFMSDVSDQAIDTMLAHFESVPSPFSVIALEPLGGAVSRVGADETAFGERSALYNLIVVGSWTDPADDAKNMRWVRGYWEAMRPYLNTAAYVNYLDADEQERVKTIYGKKYDQLVAIKDKYDPTNLFRLNQNIRPTRR
jgi:hypothetical protein